MKKQVWIGVIVALCVVLGQVASNGGPSTANAQTSAPNPPLPPLEQLLAPVALYPDALLAQVLTSATSPGQVTEMNKWVQQNKQLQGTQLQDAAQEKGFDASFIALALFPDVLDQLASQIDWTTELGTAFLSDPKGVMAAVQKLRAQAQAAGNLKSTPQQSIVTENQGGQQVIVIQPVNPQVVYVPVYNPTVVYWPPPPGTVLLAFGLGIAIGAAMSNNAYYAPYGWGAWGMGWHTHTVVVRGGAWVVPPYARYPYVRPVPMPYGGYRPRPYVYAPTNININKVTVNNPGYRGGVTPRPTPYAPVPRPPASTLPATRPGTAPARPSTAPGTGGSATAQNPRPGTGSAARPASPPATPAQRPAPSSPGLADYGSRGYNAPSNVRPSERAQTGASAFTGYQNGNSERAASQRGQSSVSRGQSRTPR
jgi:hypothetical protein